MKRCCEWTKALRRATPWWGVSPHPFPEGRRHQTPSGAGSSPPQHLLGGFSLLHRACGGPSSPPHHRVVGNHHSRKPRWGPRGSSSPCCPLLVPPPKLGEGCGGEAQEKRDHLAPGHTLFGSAEEAQQILIGSTPRCPSAQLQQVHPAPPKCTFTLYLLPHGWRHLPWPVLGQHDGSSPLRPSLQNLDHPHQHPRAPRAPTKSSWVLLSSLTLNSSSSCRSFFRKSKRPWIFS